MKLGSLKGSKPAGRKTGLAAQFAKLPKWKKATVVLGPVILVALVGMELPKTLKQLHQPNVVDAVSTTPLPTTTGATTTPGSLAAPTLAGGNGAQPATSTTALQESDVPPSANSNQLVSFSRFVGKDPFNQQVTDRTGSAPTKRSTTAPTSTTPSGPTVPSGSQPPPSAAQPTSASISVNGVAETVQVGGTFPASEPQPFFQLVSLGPGFAKIGIAGGSLASGAPTVTLVQGKPVTLMNTADGTRYQLVLVSTS